MKIDGSVTGMIKENKPTGIIKENKPAENKNPSELAKKKTEQLNAKREELRKQQMQRFIKKSTGLDGAGFNKGNNINEVI